MFPTGAPTSCPRYERLPKAVVPQPAASAGSSFQPYLATFRNVRINELQDYGKLDGTSPNSINFRFGTQQPSPYIRVDVVHPNVKVPRVSSALTRTAISTLLSHPCHPATPSTAFPCTAKRWSSWSKPNLPSYSVAFEAPWTETFQGSLGSRSLSERLMVYLRCLMVDYMAPDTGVEMGVRLVKLGRIR